MGDDGKRRRERQEISSFQSSPSPKKAKHSPQNEGVMFFGKPVPAEEARKRWPLRYQSKRKAKPGASSMASDDAESNDKDALQAKRHYTRAVVDGVAFNLLDDAYVKGEEGKPDFIAKIVELFETIDEELYFTAQWFFRAEDTVIKHQSNLIDKQRVFYSDLRDDNPLTCIVSKVKIVQLGVDINLGKKEKAILSSDLYCDMAYSVPHFSFTTLHTNTGNSKTDSEASSISDASSNSAAEESDLDAAKLSQVFGFQVRDMTLLDLYSGCGAMSTGLCLGASLSNLKLVMRWAVDINSFACKSLKQNHPEAVVRNEVALDFLCLLKEWEKLCKEFQLIGSQQNEDVNSEQNDLGNEEDDDVDDGSLAPNGEFEVGKLVAVCYGDPNNVKKQGLYFKVRWKGYGPSEDTWEPIDGLCKCKERIEEFVTRGFRSKILPLPGDVDVICGGPPCQGISGFNRYRDVDNPLNDPKNQQLVVFMDIVEFLKPKYVLMENVVDILKMSGGVLGYYAIGRLVSINYQARLGILAAGSFGVPQCRMRVFLWGAHPTEKLPQYPLPTHEFAAKGGVPVEFKEILVGYEKGESCKLEMSTVLSDAISDLPPVSNYDNDDEIHYSRAPCTEFQKYIRFRRPDQLHTSHAAKNGSQKKMLYDHIPLKLNEDDYERVCQIPRKKGANFRDLPGVLVGPNNKVEWDPSVERLKVKSGKPLVPDYAMKFVGGTSTKPFGRLWWDEYVLTVVTRAQPHNKAILHPEQDRVLTVRENARLQGFPDWYRLWGPAKERYIQVGNAVAFPVSIALGYLLARACQGVSNTEPVTPIPMKFPQCLSKVAEFQN